MSTTPVVYYGDDLVIILRLVGQDYKAISKRFQFCTTGIAYDEDGVIRTFIVELPREKYLFAPERIRFYRRTKLSGTRIIITVFEPRVTTESQERKLVEYFKVSWLCTPYAS